MFARAPATGTAVAPGLEHLLPQVGADGFALVPVAVRLPVGRVAGHV